MAQQDINFGAAANEGTGDPLRTAFEKTQDNFDELYAGQALRLRFLVGTASWDPASLADGAATSTTVTVTGALLGQPVIIAFSLAVPAGAILTADVTAADTVTAKLVNHTGGVMDLSSGTLTAYVLRP